MLPIFQQEVKKLQEQLRSAGPAQSRLVALVAERDKQYNEYNSVRDRYTVYATRANVEKTNAGDNFVILEKAEVPTKPKGPPVFTLKVLGLIGGFGLAFGIVLLWSRFANWETLNKRSGRSKWVPIIGYGLILPVWFGVMVVHIAISMVS